MHIYIEKTLFPKAAEFYEVQSVTGITILVFGGCRIPISTPERGILRASSSPCVINPV
jgi:hypothetical protein